MTAVDDARDELADRIRALVGVEPDAEEKRMFGTRAFLRGGHILVAARAGGVLLVRVTEETGSALLLESGVSIAVMGTKTMGPSWLDVAPEAIVSDESLVSFIDAARADADAVR